MQKKINLHSKIKNPIPREKLHEPVGVALLRRSIKRNRLLQGLCDGKNEEHNAENKSGECEI